MAAKIKEFAYYTTSATDYDENDESKKDYMAAATDDDDNDESKKENDEDNDDGLMMNCPVLPKGTKR